MGARETLTVAHADGTRADVLTARVPDPGGWYRRSDHREPGPFRRLSDDLAYLTLGTAKQADIAGYLQAAAGADLAVDLRNYPIDDVSTLLASHLVTAPAPWGRYALPDLANPGAFVGWESEPVRPVSPRFEGRVAILVDEETRGIGVSWPDGTPTQRVGLVPDVLVRPTVAGIAAGRDEVFDAAVQALLGRGPTADELSALDP